MQKGDTGPIVIIAHGADEKSSTGQVYATHFADKTADQIVDFLVKDKKLPKTYAGVVYLDGCYTAAGDTPENFAKKVYDSLVGKGYKFLQVPHSC